MDEYAQTVVGCKTCKFAQFKFNGGLGATLCSKLQRRIVATGDMPATRPAACPLPPKK